MLASNLLAVTIFICAFEKINSFIETNSADGANIDLSEVDSDVFLDSFGFLEKYGYPSENIPVISEDGYITTMVRIPSNGPPVILVHGVSDSSDEWLVLGPKRSLAYQLSDRGFDVWIYNSRGNRYSKGHLKQLTKKQYWDFSFEEMGTKDMPAVIDHILNITSQEKLSYIGFSQGTTIFFVMCSMRPEYNNKIQVPILLAPVAWLSNIKYPLLNILNPQTFDKFTNGIGLYELFPFDIRRAYNSIQCHKKYSSLCNIEYRLSYGLIHSEYLSPDKISVIDGHTPSGVSAKNLMHCIQINKSKRFQRFDYGAQKNLEVYSSKIPPMYDVKKVSVPVNLISSEVDWLSQYTDVKTLRNKLPNVKRFIMLNKSLEFSHLEFVFGTRVNSFINHPVINILLDELNML